MIQINNPKDCCGCTACASICSHDAITMKPDALGFLYPEVDITKCVDCGLCNNVCAFNASYDTSLNLSKPDVYGARHKNTAEVATSRSGAAFIAISDWILSQGGAVYGAGYTDHFRVVHKRATTKSERDEFKGSKYVQSDLTGIFKQVKEDLKNGMYVLFSGTPCQTSGLNSYIGKNLRNNLFLIDIVCHGVPGPYLWRDYISHLEKKQGDEIIEVNFRDKLQFGWSSHHETFRFKKSGDRKIWFPNNFYKTIMFRHSCGKCYFTNTQRSSDITIGDFWGWEKTDSNVNADNRGLSLILVNTEKGRELWNSVRTDLNVIPAKLENCLQPNLCHPTDMHPNRISFENDYKKKGFEYVYKKYIDSNNITLLVKLRNMLSKVKNILIKNILH